MAEPREVDETRQTLGSPRRGWGSPTPKGSIMVQQTWGAAAELTRRRPPSAHHHREYPRPVPLHLSHNGGCYHRLVASTETATPIRLHHHTSAARQHHSRLP